MKRIIKILLIIIPVILIIAIAGKWYLFDNNKILSTEINTVRENFENQNYKVFVSESDIVKDKSRLKGLYKKYYDKFISYKAPNGKDIFIVANKQVTDDQLLRVYNILSMYLEADNGYDMEAVANKVADSGSVIVMPDGADGESKTPGLAVLGQPVYYEEAPTEGSKWYIENNYEHRDAAYEEILHFVHDYGIGTQNSSGVLPELQKEIYSATIQSLPKDKNNWSKEGLWGLGEDASTKEWLLELEKEGSLEQEYLASVVDSYYGLWAPYTESEGGMWGIYIAKDRAEIKEKDPNGYAIVSKLLPGYITYMARIEPTFEGTFKMYLDKQEPYTYKSQYLLNARLIGVKASNLVGNSQDNILMGNKGDNIIDGGEGTDVVQLSGAYEEYSISKDSNENIIMIKDLKDRDGTDELKNIEILRFTDRDIETKK